MIAVNAVLIHLISDMATIDPNFSVNLKKIMPRIEKRKTNNYKSSRLFSEI